MNISIVPHSYTHFTLFPFVACCISQSWKSFGLVQVQSWVTWDKFKPGCTSVKTTLSHVSSQAGKVQVKSRVNWDNFKWSIKSTETRWIQLSSQLRQAQANLRVSMFNLRPESVQVFNRPRQVQFTPIKMSPSQVLNCWGQVQVKSLVVRSQKLNWKTCKHFRCLNTEH